MSSSKSKSKKIICIALAVIVLIVGAVVAVKMLGKNKTDVDAGNNVTVQADETTPETPEEKQSDTSSDTEAEEATEAESEDEEAVTTEDETDAEEAETEKAETEKVTKKDNKPSTSTVSLTKKEIIALYNEAANKVKTDAKKVTRNFKNTRYDTSKSVLPSALESMANPMIEKYVKDETDPVHYTTKEDIIENYPAPKQTYSSKLTVSDVDEATCVDNGKEYVITLKLASCKNPTAGVKVGAACHIMDVTSIKASDTSMIKKFDAIYENCVIRCKIDKATNRVTWANFYTPFTIDSIINVFFSEVVTIAVMSYERDYTITY